MLWFVALVYDWIMAPTERACLASWRREVLGEATGAVLEIGSGTGVNLQHYPTGLTRLVLTEPDGGMRRQIEAKSELPVEILDAGAEDLPFPKATFDTVVSTLVLCTVPDPPAVLRELHRILKPGGKLLFLEHVAAPEGSARRRWQRRLEPLWKRVAGGCCLTRETAATLVSCGFELDRCKAESMRRSLPILRPTIRGVARRVEGSA